MRITKLNGALAARVEGIDWSAGLGADDYATIGTALYEHQVLAVSAAGMSPDQHVALARHFGEPEHHEFFNNLGPGLEHITVLDSAAGDRSSMWHIDEPFLENPPAITLTHAQQLPDWGGDTSFVSLHAAYDELSERMQAHLEGLEAVHDLACIAEMRWRGGAGSAAATGAELASGKQAQHPLIRVHPVTGRKALWVSPTYTRFIAGVPMLEADVLLDFCHRHLMKPEFGYRHTWQPGDLLVWDNRSVMHHAAYDFGGRRVMYRVSVMV